MYDNHMIVFNHLYLPQSTLDYSRPPPHIIIEAPTLKGYFDTFKK